MIGVAFRIPEQTFLLLLLLSFSICFLFCHRINKKGSQKDSEQKAAGNYFFYGDEEEDEEDDE